MEALEVLEKEKNISKDTLLEAIEQSLIQACKNHFGKADNVKVSINAQTGDFKVVAEKTVVDLVQDPIMEIALSDAKRADSRYELGDIVPVEIKSKEFGRIAKTSFFRRSARKSVKFCLISTSRKSTML